jgi:hypothetical protein
VKTATTTATETETELAVETEVDRDDVDDIIGIAARLEMEAEGRLGLDEVEAIAAELDIDPALVREAAGQLKAKRATQRREAVAAKKRRRTLVTAVAGVLATVLLALSGLVGVGHNGLTDRYATVEAAQAQVVQVTDHQEKIEARYKGLELTPDREAEIIGAGNRVRVETRRYDKAAAEYNRYADGIAGSAAQFIFTHPSHMRLSTP